MLCAVCYVIVCHVYYLVLCHCVSCVLSWSEFIILLCLLQLEEMRSNHERQVLENDRLLQEKEERVTELLTNLKQLRGDIGSAHLPDGSVVASVGGLRPPGLARRTATIGTQTSDELLGSDTEEAAVLPVDDSLNNAYPLTNGGGATMMSLGPAEEVHL